MYLHKDKETFKDIIEQVADDTGRAAVVIENRYGAWKMIGCYLR